MGKIAVKGLGRVVFFVLIIFSGFCSSLYAAEQQSEFALTADYFTKYIWRGQNLNDKSVFQPSVSVGLSGFTASVWGNLDLKKSNQHAGEFTEFDYGLDYSASVPDINGVSFSIGALYYDFPNTTSEPTTELYGGLNFDLPLAPYIKWYRDVKAINGSYLQFGVGHSIGKIWELSDKCYCGLQIGSSIGYGSPRYNKGYFGVDSERLNDWTSSIAFPFCMGAWTIKPSINYSTILSDVIRTETPKNDNFWAGLLICTEF